MILAIRSLAVRCEHLDAEADQLQRHIDTITASAAPRLRAVHGVGPDTAATLLAAIGDNPERINSDGAFAKLCGVCPLEASSGKTVRHRLNRGGNRDANRALHVILVVRMRRHQPTRDYMARRLAEGKTKNEIMRCLIGLHRSRNLLRPQIHPRNRCSNIGASAIEIECIPARNRPTNDRQQQPDARLLDVSGNRRAPQSTRLKRGVLRQMIEVVRGRRQRFQPTPIGRLD